MSSFGNYILGAGGGVAAASLLPSDVSGLFRWYRADTLTGYSDNDPVDPWTDDSGNGKHAAQTDSTQRPLYKTNVVNSLPGLLFDGVNDVMVIPGQTRITGGLTAYLMANWPASPNGIMGLSASHYLFFTSGGIHLIMSGTSIQIGANSTVQSGNHLLSFRRDASNDFLCYWDNADVTEGTPNDGTRYDIDDIGASYSDSDFFGGHLYEIAIFDETNGTNDYAGLRSSLLNKWT